MNTSDTMASAPTNHGSNIQRWEQLYTKLRPIVLSWVYESLVPSWQGQEADIADDILQETIIRSYRFINNAASSHRSVNSQQGQGYIYYLSRTIARNYLQDLRRRELRLTHVSSEEIEAQSLTDPEEMAQEQLEQEDILTSVASIIAFFPSKQREAILMDLAWRTDFEETPTHLETAFAKQGINLKDYLHPLPTNPVERSRHAALLCIAYKRLKNQVRARSNVI